jgi:hypothetical protein
VIISQASRAAWARGGKARHIMGFKQGIFAMIIIQQPYLPACSRMVR